MDSYISDSKWNNSFIGRFCWVYKGRGLLEFTENALIYSGKKLKIHIDKDKITQINLGRYHRTAKPITLNFIEIKYVDNNSQEQCLFFTPTAPSRNPWFTSVWKTNKYVKKRLEEITEWSNS